MVMAYITDQHHLDLLAIRCPDPEMDTTLWEEFCPDWQTPRPCRGTDRGRLFCGLMTIFCGAKVSRCQGRLTAKFSFWSTRYFHSEKQQGIQCRYGLVTDTGGMKIALPVYTSARVTGAPAWAAGMLRPIAEKEMSHGLWH
jgi:hypothetical protein